MKKYISIIMILGMLIFCTNAFAYSDIQENHWAWEYVEKLSDMKIIGGYPDGSFCPDGYVTRAEFAKMLVLSLELNEKSESTYPDIENHWAKDYIIKSAEFTHNPTSEYSPDSKASRGEIAFALASALKLDDATSDMISDYSDLEKVDADIAPKLASAIKSGIMNGYEDKTLRADNHVTRAEVCTLIVRAIKHRGNIESDLENEKSDDAIAGGGEESVTPENKNEESQNGGKDEQTDKTESKFPEDMEHMYTLYPLRHLILVCSVSQSSDDEGNEAVKIRYRLAGDDEEYTSVIPDDDEITVGGTKSKLSDIRKGDLIVMNTAFHGYIDSLSVLSSLKTNDSDSDIDSVIPNSAKLGKLGSGKDYEFACGVVTAFERGNKSYEMKLKVSDDIFEVTVPKNALTEIYESRGRNSWISDGVSAIEEGNFVYVRLTDGDVTEVIVYR